MSPSDRADATWVTFSLAPIPSAVYTFPEIAAVDGIDMLFLGPHDLSGSIGRLERLGEDEPEALCAEAEAAILASGKPMATGGRPRWSFGELKQRGQLN